MCELIPRAILHAALIFGALMQGYPLARADQLIFLDQGLSDFDRANFYSQDQGSRIMPLSWLKALKQANGHPFLEDSLGRYGYLPNPGDENGLPVGFTAAGTPPLDFAGMTCSACHTRQISAEGRDYRIDGGPAIADWQRFSLDLDAAVNRVINNDAEFQSFASAVPPSGTLREDLKLWYEGYHVWISALPNPPWGPARMDAVSMIFGRLAGLDIGPPPTYLIEKNIAAADAPVRYPFLWNASKQDWTQWSGFAPNGTDVLGLFRNLGQVYGVYARFHPKMDWFHIPNVIGFDFLDNNSANFDGLGKLEQLIKKIRPPKWPWPIDESLRAKGEGIFQRPPEQGGCVQCHGINTSDSCLPGTWRTPVKDVGTDTRQWSVLKRQVDTGALKGARLPFNPPLKEKDSAGSLLGVAVIDTIIEENLPLSLRSSPGDVTLEFQLPPQLKDFDGFLNTQGNCAGRPPPAKDPENAYEARVLEGIWAAAPYLHNGSVPTLWELLKPAKERVASFKVGPAYDLKDVGLAVEQTKFNFTLNTTADCDQKGARDSGNSHCGHEYGTTQLKDDEKRALLEYLKTL